MTHHRRRGFSLLEVMVALAILVVSLTLLAESQSNAALITREAERVITATDLANGKMTEAMLYLEEEGFQNNQVHQHGDFDQWGDEALAIEFGKELEDYHWEWWISEIDLQLAGDIVAAAQDLQGSGLVGEGASTPGMGDMGGLGAFMNSQMITEMLAPYIREVRVRVWWGEDSKKAADSGNEVVLVTHAVNPTGVVQQLQGEGLPQ